MLLITQPEFTSTSWKTAFPNIELQNKSVIPSNLDNHQVVWIVSQIPEWQDLVLKATSAGKLVIVLSRKTSDNEFKLAFQAGARGYLEALSNPQILQTVYKSVKAGALWIPENLINKMIHSISPKIESGHSPDLEVLTATEKRVAEKVALGDSNSEVANELNVCERTIKSHLTSIYQKLNVRDRMHLMLFMQGKSD